MVTEIFVEGSRLDISADISSLLTFAIDDIKDFASRQTTFSKTVVLPGTANNNAIFGNIFETGIANGYDPTLDNIGFNFNPAKSARCIIFQDNLQTFKGTLRLLEIDRDKKGIEYEVALNGDLTGLSIALSSGFLTDLDFSEYDLLWNETNITNSWDNVPGSGVYFPLIDYGAYSVIKHNWNFRTFRPALYVKEYIDKMFDATGGALKVVSYGVDTGPLVFVNVSADGLAHIKTGDHVWNEKTFLTPYVNGTYNITGTDYGFTVVGGIVTATTNPSGSGPGDAVKYDNTAGRFRYQCALFNTMRFKRLIIPHNQKQLTKLTGSVLHGDSSTEQHIINHTSGPNNDDVIFTSSFGGLFTNVSGKVFTYTGASTVATTLNIHLDGKFNFKKIVPPSISDYSCTIIVQKNGVDYYFDGLPITDDSGFDAFYVKDFAIPITFSTGDTWQIHYKLFGGPAGPADVYVEHASMEILSASTVSAPLDYGELLELKFALPQNIRQVDFLTSIVKLFNLYVYESQFDDRTILITPFVDFYSSSSGNAIDWTYKLNRDAPIKIKPLAELNSKIYNFNFKDDSDYYNDLYKKRYNQGYGSYTFDTEFEFASQTNKLELIFASTPLVGYVGEEKVYPTIFKQTGNAPTITEENIDSVIRIMQTKKIIGVASWNMNLLSEKQCTGGLGTSAGSAAVVGYGTQFFKDLLPGDNLYTSSGLVGRVLAIVDDTHLNLYSTTSLSLLNALFTTLIPSAIIGPHTDYGYAGHFDDPDNPSNDLNFGVLNELLFALTMGDLTKTQFNIYWSSYMAEITDKDSKMLIAKFYLTPKDIFALDFSKFIVVDGVLFRLNKIIDYNATIPSDCQVELLKVINTSYSFPIGGIPDVSRTLDWTTGDPMEYDDALEIFYY